MELPVVQSLWTGPRLSVMEQLSIRSFLQQGHPFHLYTWGPVDQVPTGTVVRSITDILSPIEATNFCGDAADDDMTGPCPFAGEREAFRYKLLHARGGWWTDLDIVCVRPFEFRDDHVLGHSREPDGRRRVATALIKAPAGSPLMQFCWERSATVNRSPAASKDAGTSILGEALERVPAPVRILEPTIFSPIDYWQVWQLIRERQMPERCHAIRLWRGRWDRERLDPDAVYDLESLYEQLKRRFGVTSPAGAAYGPGWHSLTQVRIRQFKAGLRRTQPLLRAA
ncbi:MAG TPA: hypothetical protein VKB78_11510 [Pirellulales bacterium]|nr:hypothetical protein [Pirellulales bacterium]